MARAYKCDRCGEYHLDIWSNRFEIERNYQPMDGTNKVQKCVLTLCPKCVSSLHLRDDISQNAFNDMIAQLAYENPAPDLEEEKDADNDLNEGQYVLGIDIALDEVKEETTHETQHD